jgi:hypothetical protein
MKLFGLGYQKFDMCPNFYMLYYIKNIDLTECRTCRHVRINPELVGEWFLSHIEN